LYTPLIYEVRERERVCVCVCLPRMNVMILEKNHKCLL
jgi:hypothetical protein